MSDQNRTDGFIHDKVVAEGRKQAALAEANDRRIAGLNEVRRKQADDLAAAEQQFKEAQAQHNPDDPSTWQRTQDAGRKLQNLKHYDFHAASADVDIAYQAAVHAAEREYADSVRRAKATHGIIQ